MRTGNGAPRNNWLPCGVKPTQERYLGLGKGFLFVLGPVRLGFFWFVAIEEEEAMGRVPGRHSHYQGQELDPT